MATTGATGVIAAPIGQGQQRMIHLHLQETRKLHHKHPHLDHHFFKGVAVKVQQKENLCLCIVTFFFHLIIFCKRSGNTWNKRDNSLVANLAGTQAVSDIRFELIQQPDFHHILSTVIQHAYPPAPGGSHCYRRRYRSARADELSSAALPEVVRATYPCPEPAARQSGIPAQPH